jgi:hypothetical protein
MSAIAALCDHATTVQAFFDRALWQPVECARFDIFYDAVRPALRRDPGSGWSCDTAADWCGRRAVDDAVKLRTDVAVADIVEAARAKFRDLDTERKTLLETASKLYPAAIRECLDRGLVDSAVRAVEHLGDVLRGLRDVADDWSDHRGALTVAVGKARVFAGATPAAPPAVVDDEHATLAKTLKGKNLAVLWLLNDRGAISATSAWKRSRIAAAIGVTDGVIQNAMKALKRLGEESLGRPLVKSDSPGSWLTADGSGVARSIAAPDVEALLRSYPRLALKAGGSKAG